MRAQVGRCSRMPIHAHAFFFLSGICLCASLGGLEGDQEGWRLDIILNRKYNGSDSLENRLGCQNGFKIKTNRYKILCVLRRDFRTQFASIWEAVWGRVFEIPEALLRQADVEH